MMAIRLSQSGKAAQEATGVSDEDALAGLGGVGRARPSLEAVVATPYEAELLDVAPGAPLVLGQCLTIDPRGLAAPASGPRRLTFPE